MEIPAVYSVKGNDYFTTGDMTVGTEEKSLQSSLRGNNSPMTAEIAGISPRRGGFTRRDPRATLAPDLVEQDFTAPAPNRLWVTDLTVITTGEGPLWLSAIPDAFPRRVVACETSARADADLVLTTLKYALASRGVEPGKLIHHADHGCRHVSLVEFEEKHYADQATERRGP
ncbi:DDE-type integrase/transposase/recombinase [Streptomyces mirabilis]|uniref:DDE-type integrase/transposase/recombinase n=1 Tax=Streptomyces mirabilis TaxID=68239 RepID=UPI0036D9EFED